jgi:G6PDH family F420-dependent oxidoreductase
VLAAVAARTKRIIVGPDVTVPIGGRYHPAIVAQAAATMEKMFPGRFVLGVGSGEAMNERRFLGYWPKWEERMERMIEGVDLIKRLWREKDYFDFDGKYFKMKTVMYHLRPSGEIPIYFSAVGKKSSRLAGIHADRLITSATVEWVRDVVLPNFNEGAISAGRDPNRLDKAVLIDMATGPVEKILRRCRKISAGSSISSMFNEMDPRKIQAAAGGLSDEQILSNMYVFESGDQVLEVLARYKKEGIGQVIISEMSVDPERAMRTYSSKVIPHLGSL